jgi:hypothetical protein
MDDEWSFLDNDSFGFGWFINDPFDHSHDQSLTQSQNQLPPQVELPRVTPQPLPRLQPQIDFQEHEQQQRPTQLYRHPQSQRTVFTLEFQREISRWFIQQISTPLQTKATENYFIVKYGLTRRQVKTAFNNRRQRLVVPFRLEHPKQIQQNVISQLESLELELVCVDE